MVFFALKIIGRRTTAYGLHAYSWGCACTSVFCIDFISAFPYMKKYDSELLPFPTTCHKSSPFMWQNIYWKHVYSDKNAHMQLISGLIKPRYNWAAKWLMRIPSQIRVTWVQPLEIWLTFSAVQHCKITSWVSTHLYCFSSAELPKRKTKIQGCSELKTFPEGDIR